MHFNHVYITAEGYALLGSATAGSSPGQSNPSKIIWENAITSSVVTADKSVSWINSATSSSFPTSSYTGSGSVLSAVHNQQNATVDDGQGGTTTIKADVVTVTLEINNNSYSGSADTLCVFGRLEGSSAKKLIVVASTDNPETIHPKTSQPYNAIIDLHIELSGTAVSEVSADSSWYASANAFNKLAGRVVTTHSEVSDTTGENQSIYGVKKFYNNTEHIGNIIPVGTTNIGSTSARWNTIYATTFDGNATSSSNVGILGNDTNDNYPLIFTNSVNSNKSTAVNKQLYTDTANSLRYNPNSNTLLCTYVGSTTSRVNIHASRIYLGYQSEAYFVATTSSYAGSIASAGNIIPSLPASSNNAGFSLGHTSIRWNVLYTNMITQTSRTCDTAANTVNKTVTIPSFTLEAGRRIAVKFTKGNSSSSPTLNITDSLANDTSTGAKNINCLRADLPENSIVYLTYNGESWDVEGANVSAAQIRTYGASDDKAYPLLFVSSANTTSTIVAYPRSLYTDKGNVIKYNPSTKTLACTTFKGALDGNANTATSATSATRATNLSYSTTAKLTATNTQVTAKTNVVPDTSNAYTLGSTSSKWKDIYAVGSSGGSYFEIGNDTVDGKTEPVIRPSTSGYGFVGTDNFHIYRGYFDYLYIGTNATSLPNYIDDRVSSTTYTLENGISNYYGYVGYGGLFIATQITIRYGFFGSSDNWNSSRSNLRVCRADSIVYSNSDNTFSTIPCGHGILVVRISAFASPLSTNIYAGRSYRILSDLRWSDTGSQPSETSTNRSYTFTGIVICQSV